MLHMSDLSLLNPTPHAIAVYASQPLSPVATQHSLPSGRYSLLGPDFHRLDRTSFCGLRSPETRLTLLWARLERLTRLKRNAMAWSTPTLVEICIGLEINGYLPPEF